MPQALFTSGKVLVANHQMRIALQIEYCRRAGAKGETARDRGIWPKLRADFGDHEFTVAACGPPISADYCFPPNFWFTRQLARGGFFRRLHQGQLRPLAAGPSRLPGAHGRPASVVLDRHDLLAPRRTTTQPVAGGVLRHG